MTWLLVASFGVSAATGLLGAGKANAAASENRTAGLQREAVALDQSSAENRALSDVNLQNTIRTGYKVGLLNVQRAQAKKAAMQAGVNLSRNALKAMGSAQANAAASGTIGSSVDAITQDIQMRVDEAGAQMGADYAAQEENFDTQLHDILLSGQDAIRAPGAVNVATTAKANHVGVGEVLGAAAIQTAGSYFSAKMTLGSVKPPATGGSLASPAGAEQNMPIGG